MDDLADRLDSIDRSIFNFGKNTSDAINRMSDGTFTFDDLRKIISPDDAADIIIENEDPVLLFQDINSELPPNLESIKHDILDEETPSEDIPELLKMFLDSAADINLNDNSSLLALAVPILASSAYLFSFLVSEENSDLIKKIDEDASKSNVEEHLSQRIMRSEYQNTPDGVISQMDDYDAVPNAYIQPTAGVLTSGFGMRMHPIHKVRKMHNGLDIAAPKGTHVVAPYDGTVSSKGRGGGYGIYVYFEDENEKTHMFGHLSDSSDAIVGKAYERGDLIGLVGSTGNSTGNHLHWGVKEGSSWIDPLTLPGIGGSADPEITPLESSWASKQDSILGVPRSHLVALYDALSGHESSDMYYYPEGHPRAGEVVTNVDSGAFGNLQIMPSNWSSWAIDAGLASDADKTPENYDIIARNKLIEYYKKFNGNIRHVATAWYSGPGHSGWQSMEDKSQDDRPQVWKSSGRVYSSIKDYSDDIYSRYNRNLERIEKSIRMNNLS